MDQILNHDLDEYLSHANLTERYKKFVNCIDKHGKGYNKCINLWQQWKHNYDVSMVLGTPNYSREAIEQMRKSFD